MESGANQPTSWQVELLRATAFPTTPPSIGENDWWRMVTGTAPTEQVTRKRPSVSDEASGPFHQGVLALQLRPDRVDWLYRAPPDPTGPNFDLIGGLDESVPPFRSAVSEWIGASGLPRFHRLAFGAVLLLPVSTRDEGYACLARFLPEVSLGMGDIADFLFQINRPRMSNSCAGKMMLNRLTKWSVAQSFHLMFAVAPTHSRFEPETVRFAARLELDMSTPADFARELAPESLRNLFEELVDLGIEIATKGNTP